MDLKTYVWSTFVIGFEHTSKGTLVKNIFELTGHCSVHSLQLKRSLDNTGSVLQSAEHPELSFVFRFIGSTLINGNWGHQHLAGSLLLACFMIRDWWFQNTSLTTSNNVWYFNLNGNGAAYYRPLLTRGISAWHRMESSYVKPRITGEVQLKIIWQTHGDMYPRHLRTDHQLV